MRPAPGYGLDAVGDAASRQGPGVIHKYAGRALLIATGSCAVHCRYCFRRHFPYAEETAAAGGWQGAVAAIAADAIGGENVYGVSMPSAYSSEHSRSDASDLAQRLGAHYREVPIKAIVDAFMDPLQLTGLAAARSAAAQQSEQPMSLWGAPETALRYPAGRRPLRPGPHAWRASSFPA